MNNGTGSCIMNIGGNFTLNSGYFTIVTGVTPLCQLQGI